MKKVGLTSVLRSSAIANDNTFKTEKKFTHKNINFLYNNENLVILNTEETKHNDPKIES